MAPPAAAGSEQLGSSCCPSLFLLPPSSPLTLPLLSPCLPAFNHTTPAPPPPSFLLAVLGTDYTGNVCGADVPGKSYITYPRTNDDFLMNFGKSNPLDYSFYGICMPSCPGALSVVCNYDTAAKKFSAVGQADLLNCLALSTAVPGGGSGAVPSCSDVSNNCWVIPQATTSVLFR